MRSYKEILDELETVKYDFITFLSGDKKDSIAIMASDYNEAGEPVGGSAMGEMYHIMLFRDHKEDEEKYDDVDCFEAILNKTNHLRAKEGKLQNRYLVMNLDDEIDTYYLLSKIPVTITKYLQVRDIEVHLVNAILKAKEQSK